MAYSGSQTTRLGVSAFSRGLYGSFAGKAEEQISGVFEFLAPNYHAHFTADREFDGYKPENKRPEFEA